MNSDTSSSNSLVNKLPAPPDELIQFIEAGSKFIIAGHKEPDGDCVGSQLALRSALLRMGKEVIVCSAGPFFRSELRGYTGYFQSTLSEEDKFDAKLIIVDCTDKRRTGSLEKYIDGFPYAMIDHHVSGTHQESTLQAPVYVQGEALSCTMLIEKLIITLGMELTSEEATLLLFGLCTDTGFFRHLTEKNSDVFEAAARMVRYGANPKNIYDLINSGRSLNSRILLGHILARTESHYGGKLLFSSETLEECNIFGHESRDTDSFIKQLQSVEGVEVILLVRQESTDECSVSLRSVDKIDVSKIAASFGGGGHKNASGLKIKGNLSDIKDLMLESFKNIFI